MSIERIILTTGGTGGHIFPALAVAEEVHLRYPDASILFMGSRSGPEADLAVQAGLEFVGLPVRGVFGRGLRAVAALVGMGRSLAKASAIVKKVQPQVVLGFGGYAGFAGVLAAHWRGIPTAIHEQNSVAGISNRVLAKRVDRVFTSLPDSVKLHSKADPICTGNPVRAAIAALAQSAPRTPESIGKRVLVMGGSQGSRAINTAIVANLPALLDNGIQLWHQTGLADASAIREAYRKAGAAGMRVDPFITDMAEAYAWADVAVCRAGATSIAELTAAAVPALFIPFPQATHDHQSHNARQLVQVGAANYIAQKEIQEPEGKPELLGQSIIALTNDPVKLSAMSTAMRGLARPDAAQRLVDELEKLIQR